MAEPVKTIPVLRPLLPRAERLVPYIQRIDASRSYSNYGPLVSELEKRLAEVLRAPAGAIASASNGTAALAGVLLARCGRCENARNLVVMPSFTFVATAIAAEQCGYQPYLVDAREVDWLLSPESLIGDRALENAAAVMPVAAFGRPVPQEPWLRFQRQTGIPVIIDGAASFDLVSASPQGFVGELPVAFSFHATKSFSTGEGGAVVSTDGGLVERAMQALNFGFWGERNSRMASINGKMSEYHAAVGLAELDGWDDKLAALHSVAGHYRRAAREAGIADVLFSWPEISACYVLYKSRDAGESGRIGRALREAGIDYRFWYGGGLHRQSHFEKAPRTALPMTELLGETLIGLPVAPDLDESTIDRVVSLLARVTSALS